MFYVCCTLLYVHSSIAIILMGKRKLIALLNLSSWCLVMVERLFLAVPQGCLQFVIVVFPDHTHLLFLLCSAILTLYSDYASQKRYFIAVPYATITFLFKNIKWYVALCLCNISFHISLSVRLLKINYVAL